MDLKPLLTLQALSCLNTLPSKSFRSRLKFWHRVSILAKLLFDGHQEKLKILKELASTKSIHVTALLCMTYYFLYAQQTIEGKNWTGFQ